MSSETSLHHSGVPGPVPPPLESTAPDRAASVSRREPRDERNAPSAVSLVTTEPIPRQENGLNASRMSGRAAAIALTAVFVIGPATTEARPPSLDAATVETASVDTVDVTEPPADHHIHIWSPAAVDLFRTMQEELGETVIPSDRLHALDGDDVVAALDSAGVRTGVLLSTAYFFGSPEYDAEDEYAQVRAENDFVARQVRAHPERLTAFFSVNPLADYALREIDRLEGAPEFAGLKLHLANSGFSFRDTAEVIRLREIFERASESALPVVIHLYTRDEEYGRRDVDIFIDEVLPAAPDIPIQIAHPGGGGGFGAATRGAVDAFASALDEHPELIDGVFFDLSGVPHPEYLAQGREKVLEKIRVINDRFVTAVRRLGSDRIVYATDWPVVSMPRYLEGLRESLSLEPETFRDLIDDRAPYLRDAGTER